jgi:uncharacterized protein
VVLRAQGFGSPRGTGLSAKRPVGVLERLGALQLDSVSVLGRPQDVVPFSRVGAYDVAAMHREVYEEQRGFEYWGHEASWLPVAEYRYFRFRMEHYRRSSWWRKRAEGMEGLLDAVLARIRKEGALTSADFEDPRESRGTWWDRKPAKIALEALFASGDLMCARRTAGFARVYDLPERVLPVGLDTTDPGTEESARYLMRRAIAAMGVATGVEAADYYRLRPEHWRPALRTLAAAREVVPVAVEGWKEVGYATPGTLAGPLRVPAHRPTFLSPFDNLIWHRGRTERLFGFHYRIGIYTPQAQRTHGYYVLPLLARGRLGGRADLKLERKASTLRVLGLWLEGEAPGQPATPEEAASALRDLAAHLGAARIQMERAEPVEARDVLRTLCGVTPQA